MNNKYNKNRKLNQSQSQPKQAIQEYDLTQSFRRVSSYSKPTRKTNRYGNTNTDQEETFIPRRDAVASSSERYETSTMGIPSLESYNRLEDKFTSFSDKNDQEHKDLRREFERKIDHATDDLKEFVKDLGNKIEKRLSIQWYVWTIIALVTIVGIWWMLSYKDVVELPKEFITIEHRLDNLDKTLNDNQKAKQDNEIPPQKATMDDFNNSKTIAK